MHIGESRNPFGLHVTYRSLSSPFSAYNKVNALISFGSVTLTFYDLALLLIINFDNQSCNYCEQGFISSPINTKYSNDDDYLLVVVLLLKLYSVVCAPELNSDTAFLILFKGLKLFELL